MTSTLRLRLLLLGAAAALAACAETARAPLAPEAALSLNALQGGLLSCTPLPQATASQTIGPEGGVIAVGPHSLTVPAGALSAPVTITAVAPSDTVRRVDFAPDGLQFAQPARLTMSYQGCGLAGVLVPKRIVQIDHDLGILEALPSLDLRSLLTTSASLEHFSGYAVAW
jgi:hypothetical protein